jgi:hypothetical protein
MTWTNATTRTGEPAMRKLGPWVWMGFVVSLLPALIFSPAPAWSAANRVSLIPVSYLPMMIDDWGATQNSLFGVLNDRGQHYADEWARGVRATTLELNWKAYEPQPGVYNQAYVNERRQHLAMLKAQGWFVQLVPGYHYVPDWVFSAYPGTYYVNQYGERYDPDPQSQGDFRVINAPFNPQARALIAGYLRRIFQDFNASDIDAIRLGGGPQGELRYPPNVWNGHTNSYWAFDASAQNPTLSGIPATIVGWRPGIDPNPGSIGREQLIVNAGFELTHGYFASPAWVPDDQVQAQVVTANPHSGNRALQLTLSSPHRIHQWVRVSPGTNYRFAAWLRSGTTGGWARMFLNQYDAQMQPIAGAPYGRLETPATGWTYLSGMLAVSANTHYLKVELDGSQPGAYYFDDLMLERDAAPTHISREMTVPLGFYDWYIARLADYQNWQIAEVRNYYSGHIDLLYAGKGILTGYVTDALTNDLRGNSVGESNSALYAGAMYDRLASAVQTTNGVALYLTGIEDPPANQVDDVSPYPNRWSAARWFRHLSERYHLPVWGENGGHNNAGEMWLAAQRMRENGFTGMMWAFESELYANPNPNGYATIADYQAVIRQFGIPRGRPR